MTFVEPIKAAAGIILTREREPRVLLARRSKTLRFMGGFHVFPGGRVDDDEPIHRIRGAGDPLEAAAIHAVAREIFEETGLLFAKGRTPGLETLRLARRGILEGTDRFDAFLGRHDLHIDAEDFEAAGVWVTPAIAPVRFDTRYYVVRQDRAEGHELVVGEIDALDWLTPCEARRRWRQNQLQLPPPVAYVLQQLASYPFPEVWERLRNVGEHRGEKPAKMEFCCGIYLLPLLSPTLAPATHTNCVIVGEQDLYIIDPGTHNSEEFGLLARQLQMLIDLGGTVRGVLLTHSHVDHVGAAKLCRTRYGAPIWAHDATARQLDFPVDRRLSDNELIPIAGDPEWRLRCIHTPGHDPGHLCFIEETTGTLIAGDMIANPGTIVVSIDHGGDMTQFLASLERLANEDCNLILPGHGMPMTNPREKLRKHLEHRLWREEKLKTALAEGLTRIEELLAKVYDDVPVESWALAEYTLRAHLARLGTAL